MDNSFVKDPDDPDYVQEDSVAFVPNDFVEPIGGDMPPAFESDAGPCMTASRKALVTRKQNRIRQLRSEARNCLVMYCIHEGWCPDVYGILEDLGLFERNPCMDMPFGRIAVRLDLKDILLIDGSPAGVALAEAVDSYNSLADWAASVPSAADSLENRVIPSFLVGRLLESLKVVAFNFGSYLAWKCRGFVVPLEALVKRDFTDCAYAPLVKTLRDYKEVFEWLCEHGLRESPEALLSQADVESFPGFDDMESFRSALYGNFTASCGKAVSPLENAGPCGEVPEGGCPGPVMKSYGEECPVDEEPCKAGSDLDGSFCNPDDSGEWPSFIRDDVSADDADDTVLKEVEEKKKWDAMRLIEDPDSSGAEPHDDSGDDSILELLDDSSVSGDSPHVPFTGDPLVTGRGADELSGGFGSCRVSSVKDSSGRSGIRVLAGGVAVQVVPAGPDASVSVSPDGVSVNLCSREGCSPKKEKPVYSAFDVVLSCLIGMLFILTVVFGVWTFRLCDRAVPRDVPVYDFSEEEELSKKFPDPLAPMAFDSFFLPEPVEAFGWQDDAAVMNKE